MVSFTLLGFVLLLIALNVQGDGNIIQDIMDAGMGIADWIGEMLNALSSPDKAYAKALETLMTPITAAIWLILLLVIALWK